MSDLSEALPPPMSAADRLSEAVAHLGAALAQVIESDDKIIIGHVREAYRLLGGRDLRCLDGRSPI